MEAAHGGQVEGAAVREEGTQLENLLRCGVSAAAAEEFEDVAEGVVVGPAAEGGQAALEVAENVEVISA